MTSDHDYFNIWWHMVGHKIIQVTGWPGRRNAKLIEAIARQAWIMSRQWAYRESDDVKNALYCTACKEHGHCQKDHEEMFKHLDAETKGESEI